MKEGETVAKILLFDVESFPNIGYTWGKWEQNVIEFIQEKMICSFAWKWLDKPKIECRALPMYKGYVKNRFDNTQLIKELHSIISEADIVIAHNVDGFDSKMSNTDFILHGLPPPPVHKTIDTLKVAKSRFAFNSNKLDDLADRLGVGRKISTGGFKLWKECMAGDPDAWYHMIKYNKHDVLLLEGVYLKERPWIKNHPVLSLSDNCPVCEGKWKKKDGLALTKSGPKQRMRCLTPGCFHAYYTKLKEN